MNQESSAIDNIVNKLNKANYPFIFKLNPDVDDETYFFINHSSAILINKPELENEDLSFSLLAKNAIQVWPYYQIAPYQNSRENITQRFADIVRLSTDSWHVWKKGFLSLEELRKVIENIEKSKLEFLIKQIENYETYSKSIPLMD
jgi:hypothetical protein